MRSIAAGIIFQFAVTVDVALPVELVSTVNPLPPAPADTNVKKFAMLRGKDSNLRVWLMRPPSYLYSTARYFPDRAHYSFCTGKLWSRGESNPRVAPLLRIVYECIRRCRPFAFRLDL